MTREQLRLTSNGELDAIASSLFTLKQQVRLNRDQDCVLIRVWCEFCARDRAEDYKRLHIEAREAWKAGKVPAANQKEEVGQ